MMPVFKTSDEEWRKVPKFQYRHYTDESNAGILRHKKKTVAEKHNTVFFYSEDNSSYTAVMNDERANDIWDDLWYRYHKSLEIWTENKHQFHMAKYGKASFEMKDFEEGFLSCRAFIVMVTAKLLENKEFFTDGFFALAVENRMPVIPIMVEPGLEEEFDKLAGACHLLSRIPDDKNRKALEEYKDSLFRTLDFLFTDPEVLEEINRAFAGSIFVSYRKKDFRLVEKLSNYIHEDERLTDIAVWWDSQLVPGENYNEDIDNALHDSRVFVLLITPSILEPGNYVQRIEYPTAIESNKLIIPVEAVKTDRDQLALDFPDLPEVIDLTTLKKLSKAEYLQLKEQLGEFLTYSPEEMVWKHSDAFFEALVSNYADVIKDRSAWPASHCYEMGLAYFNGVQVEKNYDQSLEMFRLAAAGGDVRGYRYLLDNYSWGASNQGPYRKLKISKEDFYKECISVLGELLKDPGLPDDARQSLMREKAKTKYEFGSWMLGWGYKEDELIWEGINDLIDLKDKESISAAEGILNFIIEHYPSPQRKDRAREILNSINTENES
ncbi:MAG: TIR domain-containing protein [Lachnospiraceae bacterium]|nr:TIR domain-containing protein [Lachnospiraceae bacterium]